MKITYDEKGCGETYGIQFTGDIKYLLKALYHLLVTKHLEMPLESHHGTYFKLVDYGLTFKIAAHKWSHDNKGNGMLPMQFIISDENWYTILTEHGHTDKRQGNLSIKSKTGLLELLKRTGFTIADKWNHDNICHSVSVVVEEQANFVAHLVNKYDTTFNDFIKELKVMAEAFNVLSK